LTQCIMHVLHMPAVYLQQSGKQIICMYNNMCKRGSNEARYLKTARLLGRSV